jgi:putative ABC transport system substrate-binding protein
MINRRTLLGGLLAVTVSAAWPPSGRAQPARKISRIGFMFASSASSARADIDAILTRLRELGSVEGRDFTAEYRWADGNTALLGGLATDLVREKVDLIVTRSTPAALAAKSATREIPIVFSMVSDPVASGIVDTLAHPGGNITGWSNILPETSGKLLELIKAMVPKLSRLAVLGDPANPGKALEVAELRKAAARLGLKLRSLEVRTPKDVEDAFGKMARERPDALIVLTDGVTTTHRQRVVDLAARIKLPAIYQVREFVDAGGLLSYGLNIMRQQERTADYVHRILKGAKPGDLPVEQPTKFELLINRKTAKALGIAVPQELLLRADEVIQ